MSNPRLAVIQFPGSNCEYETQRAAVYYGFDADIIRWNCDHDVFFNYDAYILPGGFSFQDRVRAGAISSKLAITGLLVQAAEEQKLVLGICNGCQILAESGLIPDTNAQHPVEIALAHNTRHKKPYGFICDWVYVKAVNPQKSVFTRYFSMDDVIPIPVNHGEGRFVLADTVEDHVSKLAMFQYCTFEGKPAAEPDNPNGTAHNIAGLCNTKGNVMGIMPHPERAAFVKQVPFWVKSKWADAKSQYFQTGRKEEGPWEKLFVSMRDQLTC